MHQLKYRGGITGYLCFKTPNSSYMYGCGCTSLLLQRQRCQAPVQSRPVVSGVSYPEN